MKEPKWLDPKIVLWKKLNIEIKKVGFSKKIGNWETSVGNHPTKYSNKIPLIPSTTV